MTALPLLPDAPRLRPTSARSALGAALLTATTLVSPSAGAVNLVSADGPGGTYDLLRQDYTVEVPDCGHDVDHITEEFDEELGRNVFVFHAHVDEDDDRCTNFDRQRTEIRAKSSDIVANEGETLYYRWLFRLPEGFQGSPNFTHIFQIKSNAGAPVMTLTPRVSTFEITGRIGERGKTDLAPFIGEWVVVDLTVYYSNTGSLDISIQRLSDGEEIFSYAGDADMWDDDQTPHDSKFGIYRSLNSADQLRDEQVRFADFCASKVSMDECDLDIDLGTGGTSGTDPGGTGGSDGAGGGDGTSTGGATAGGGDGTTGGASVGGSDSGAPGDSNGAPGPAGGTEGIGSNGDGNGDSDSNGSSEPAGCSHQAKSAPTDSGALLLMGIFVALFLRRRRVGC